MTELYLPFHQCDICNHYEYPDCETRKVAWYIFMRLGHILDQASKQAIVDDGIFKIFAFPGCPNIETVEGEFLNFPVQESLGLEES